jgi:hypothetical protein
MNTVATLVFLAAVALLLICSVRVGLKALDKWGSR